MTRLMKVLLDLGNTRLKAGLLRLTAQGPELATTFATTYDQGQGLSQWLERHLQAEPCPQVQALGISVVTTETRRHVEEIGRASCRERGEIRVGGGEADEGRDR